MKATSLICLFLIATCYAAVAQTDSLYTQQWNRDPVLNLNATVSAQRQIITAEQIRASGYNRLSDVFQLIDGWTFATVAGDSWLMQSNGVGNYDNQNWTLMLNGQPIGLQKITALDVNLLGVSVNEIERIEIVNSTGLYLGEFTQKGLIHIITRKNPEGISYRGYYGNGISTTDQGRYQVHPGAPSFINPVGLNTSHALGFRKGNLNITGSVNYQKYYSPDTNGLRKYSQDDTLTRPLNTFINTRWEAQYTGKKMLQQIQFSYSWQDQNPDNETITYDRLVSSAGYLNQWNINDRHQLRLSVAASSDKDQLAPSSQWQLNNKLNYRYLKPGKKGNFIWQTGLGYDRVSMNIYLDNRIENIFKPYSSINIPITRKSNLFADGMVSIDKNAYAPKTSLGIYKRVSFISNWSFVAAYTEQLDVEDFTLFYALRKIPYLQLDKTLKSKQLSADFYYNLNLGNNVKFSFNSGIKRLQDETGFIPLYVYEGSISGLTDIYGAPMANLAYTNWVNRLNIHYDIIKNLVLDINYMRTGIVERSIENVRTIPKHKFTLVIQYQFPKRFTLWSRIYSQSETNWIRYGTVQTVPYPPTVLTTDLPGFITCDLGVSRKLFKEYLNLNLSVRNIFNGRQKYYPAAAQFDTRFTIGISANIERLFASRTAKP